jgi:hypothetical protein
MVNPAAVFAGQNIELTLDLGTPPGGRLRELVTAARLVAPAFSLGNIFADKATIPPERRSGYVDNTGAQPPFNELQFLADYEAAKPGAFALRDEEVIFKGARGSALKATIKHCRHPGIYRVAVYLEGSIELPYGECCHEGPQRFSRVLHLDIAVGIQPDRKQSRPVLFWTAPDRFTVSITPTDALGNIALPTRARPEIAINRVPVTGALQNPHTGELRLEFVLTGKGVAPTKDGQSLKARGSIVDREGNPQVELAAGKKLKITVTVGSTTMPVDLPAVIKDAKSGRIHPAGTAEAMQIPLADRLPFRSEREARRARGKRA